MAEEHPQIPHGSCYTFPCEFICSKGRRRSGWWWGEVRWFVAEQVGCPQPGLGAVSWQQRKADRPLHAPLCVLSSPWAGFACLNRRKKRAHSAGSKAGRGPGWLCKMMAI